MDTDNIIISLDDAFDYYEMSKRTISEEPLYCYDLTGKAFVKYKEKYKGHSVPFINSYTLCVKLINDYLNQPSKSLYKTRFEPESKNARNRVVCFLWFFEHIDGCEDFKKYEMRNMLKILKKWCAANNFAYTEPQVYLPNDD